MNTRNRDIVFWFNNPPKVEVGAYNELSRIMQSKAYYVCMNEHRPERKALNWDRTNYGNASLVILGDNANERGVECYLVDENTIHIVCGLSGPVADFICPILKKRKIEFIVVSEKPRIGWHNCKDFFSSVFLVLKYGMFKRFKYQKSVKALLPLGNAGVQLFKNLGWNKTEVFRFMYCGEYNYLPEAKEGEVNLPIKFLYVGRFGYNHGLDILMKAFDMIHSPNWQLDMAGGYGDDKDEVFKWINSRPHVNFIGKIEADNVRQTMREYDCLVVPSRLEGWNCQIAEALSVGCPVISNCYAVSSELIDSSGAGINVKSSSPEAFSEALLFAIDNPQIVESWRDRAIDSRHRFSEREVGKYLYDILAHCYDGLSKPECPW